MYVNKKYTHSIEYVLLKSFLYDTKDAHVNILKSINDYMDRL